MDQTLGKRIMINRKRLGLTQDQLAEKLGVTAQAVSKWENDQSCPDISTLPLLAEIFGISTDELLGRQQQTVHEAEVVADKTGHTKRGIFSFSIDNHQKRDDIGLAVLVILVGVLYLLSNILLWDIGFWDILWTCGLLVFGLWGLYPRISFFRLGCALLGGYSLAAKIIPLRININGGIIFAIIVVLFGLSLLADIIHKGKCSGFQVAHCDTDGQQEKATNNYVSDDTSFDYNASFGECCQSVYIGDLHSGNISTSFGSYTIDLTGIESVAENCQLRASCSFGELTLLVPSRYFVKPVSSTAFANFSVSGQCCEQPEGSIFLEAKVSFGQIKVQYV